MLKRVALGLVALGMIGGCIRPEFHVHLGEKHYGCPDTEVPEGKEALSGEAKDVQKMRDVLDPRYR